MSIVQRAIITKTEGGKLFLELCRPSACAACKAQSACSESGKGKELILEDDLRGREVGDEVTLRITPSAGIRAVMLAYLVPILLILGLLLLFGALGFSELISGISVLISIAIYFLFLRIFRRKFETELTITIE